MGGPSGLPRMPIRGWQYTKAFNPSGEYNERIATLYRDLEITLGTLDAPNEQLAIGAVKKLPDLINPDASSRWVFFRTKDLLINKLGSEKAAITMMSKDPSLLLCPRYDGLSPKLEAMLTPEEIRAVTATNGPSGLGVSTPILLGGVGIFVVAALAATSTFG